MSSSFFLKKFLVINSVWILHRHYTMVMSFSMVASSRKRILKYHKDTNPVLVCHGILENDFFFGRSTMPFRLYFLPPRPASQPASQPSLLLVM
jgi:hypothetical protein